MTKNDIIILASKSPSRAAILKGAGVLFDIVPSTIDEADLKVASKDKSPTELGQFLAREKALQVSRQNPGRVILGADQILAFENEIFDKPRNMKEARQTLERLRGKTHTLISCAVFAEDGKIVAEFIDRANLTMKNFDEAFLTDYLEEAGEKILSSVGAYQLEAEGARLFEKIDGDFFTILGLPLNPVKEFLQNRGSITP